MFKILRMICAIIAAACAVACVIVAVNWGMLPFWGCLAGGVFFFVLCLLFKFLQEDKEGRAGDSALSVGSKGGQDGSEDSSAEGDTSPSDDAADSDAAGDADGDKE
ncbi:MAG TPA: hypothetical protein H9731_02495 [Candidatus Borkfalkia excrementipullorum]|nr:hypothetical protein [Candidatus Borkfalkia excrementipullorum]